MGEGIGGIANQGLTWLFQQFGEWAFGWLYKGVSKLLDAIMELTISMPNVFWDSDIINAMLDFSAWVNVIVLSISLLILIMDITEQAGRVNWQVIMKNLSAGIVFVFFNRVIGMMTFFIASQVISMMDVQLSVPSLEPLTGATDFLGSPLMLILILVVIIIACIAFSCMSMLRNGSLFVQIIISSFYIPGIIRGDSAKLGEWLSRTVAISATFVIQYMLFAVGLGYMIGLTGEAFFASSTCFLTMFMVPKILDRFGYSSGAGGVFAAAGSAASAGLMLVK